MNKKTISLTESDLRRIVKESVNKVLNEGVGRIDSTAGDTLLQCSRNLSRVLDTIKNNVINIIEGSEGKGYTKLMNYFKYSCPQMIDDCYKPIIDEYIQSHGVKNSEDFDEPEDWHERNEHGDFDTY